MKILAALFAGAVLATVPANAATYRRFVDYMIHGNDSEGFCDQCPEVLKLMKEDPVQVLDGALQACKDTGYFTARICDEEHRMYSGTIIKIVQEMTAPIDEVCKFLGKGACGEPESEMFNWGRVMSNVADDEDPPEGSHHQDHHHHGRKSHLSFLHITDTHFDEDYDIGADANCNEPLCCTKYQNQTKDMTYFSGPWGHPLGMACDIPLRTVENMFQDIHRRRRADFAIWTGDISSHSYMGMTKERAMQDIQKTTALFKRYMPNTIVYPSIGNHDAYPDRLFPQPNVNAGEFSVKPLYEEMWNLWYEWLPKDQEATFKYGGYYTALVRPGLRIISLNTNFCYTANWWLVLGANDPAGQLTWMLRTLKEARDRQEKVLIIGHIPPGTPTCNQYWEEVYFQIVTKFRHTVTGQFYAHMHNDEIILDYSHPKNPDVASSVVYVSPSVTTSWSGMPEYRVFHTELGRIVDFENFFLNLTTANSVYFRQKDAVHDKIRSGALSNDIYKKVALEKVLYGEPRWELGYSAKKAYKLRDFSPESWQRLVKKFETDDDLFQTFYKHHVQFRENMVNLEKPCDDHCKQKLLSYMVSARTNRARKGKGAVIESPSLASGPMDTEEIMRRR